MIQDLPKRLQQLYDALNGQGDVFFGTLCDKIEVFPHPTRAQQQLGPYVTRLNRRLKHKGLVVKPGAIKGTYRLTVSG